VSGEAESGTPAQRRDPTSTPTTGAVSPTAPAPAGAARPVRRAYTPITGKRRSSDAFDRVARLRVLGWSVVGALLGFLLGLFLWVQDQGGIALIVLTTLAGWATSYFGPLLILSVAGRAGSVLYTPSGSTTPHKREYSLAESYVARELFDDAIAAFEHAIAEDPADPVPYLRIARIRRDRLRDLEGAAAWFKRMLAESVAAPGLVLLARKELIELYDVRMGMPERAAPLLARIAEEREGTPEGDWAAGELHRVKERMAAGRPEQ
jgi:tetratricopeptide (TPR) repeat protein